MKEALWKNVRVGSWLIYADRYRGVFRAIVTEVDIRVYDPGTPSRWGYPYDLTVNSGAVRIKWNGAESIENLGDLVTYGAGKLADLRKAYSDLEKRKATYDASVEDFLALLGRYKEF